MGIDKDKDIKVLASTKEELFDLLVQSMDGLIITDNVGRYVYMNKSWAEATGMDQKEAIGKYVHDVVPDTKIPQVLKSGKALSGELLRLPTSDGGELRMLCSYIPLFKDGSLIGCVAFASLHGMEEITDFQAKTEELLREVSDYRQELAQLQGVKYTIDDIVGESEPIKELKYEISRVARSSSSITIHGETGVGKELVAHAIHALSPRASQPFIKINCAAIPANLLESELFGYASGAFTGASRSGKKGKFQLADKGTLFLDEINQIPLELQPKLLRALQEHEIEPVGSESTISVDCRIITAENASLEQMVQEGTFREDLFYRLNVISLNVPPLRERREDIPLLAKALLQRLNAQLGMRVPGISKDAIRHLQEYDWPGNIRELQNVIERAMNHAWVETLTWKHFEDYFAAKLTHAPGGHGDKISSPIHKAREDTEKDLLVQALRASNGNKTKAAEMLGITRVTLYRKLEKYNLSK